MEAFFNFYTITTILLLIVWTGLFYFSHNTRREMLILGIAAVFLMPLVFTVSQLPTEVVADGFQLVTIIDLLFTFSLAGIAGVSYHAIFGKHYHKLPRAERTKTPFGSQHWLLRLFFFFTIFVWAVLLIHLFFSLTIPVAFLIASVMMAIYTISHRHDLLLDALWSSFLTAFIVFFSTTLASFFTATDISITPVTSNQYILDVPVDLIFWSLAAGLALGPLYEYIRTVELT